MIGQAAAGSRSAPGFAPISTPGAVDLDRPGGARRFGLAARLAGWGALGVLALALVWPALLHAVDVWATTEEFSFGFLVVPISGLLVWWHGKDLRRAIGAGANAGLLAVLGAVALYILAHRAGINALA